MRLVRQKASFLHRPLCLMVMLTMFHIGLAKKDLHITIKTDGAKPSFNCDEKECFLSCEKDGAIGGTCTDTGDCLCQSAPSALRIQQSRINKGDVMRPAEECDLDACNEVCYQKGGFAGGVCEDGACKCVAPEIDGNQALPFCVVFYLCCSFCPWLSSRSLITIEIRTYKRNSSLYNVNTCHYIPASLNYSYNNHYATYGE